MAKELPYFQFEPAEYLTGDVSFCSLSAQGLFIILCSYYWQRSCKLTKDQFLRRINKENEFNELVDENIIQIENNAIKISFLDEQFENATNKSKTNSINGKKGGRPKKETQNKPKKNLTESEQKGIREDKIKEDDIKEDEVLSNDIFYDVDVLHNHYLKQNTIINAVIKNKSNKLKDREHLEKRLDIFNSMLKESGRLSETFKEYSSYFRNWVKTVPEESKDKQFLPDGRRNII